MRIAVCALSAVLLSGCSWLGGGHGSSGQSYQQKYARYTQGQNQSAPQNPYIYQQNPQEQQSDPYAAEKVNGYGGFPQKPDFSGGYASGSYGSHVADVGQKGIYATQKPRFKKPRIRGSLSLGIEKGASGDLLDYPKMPGLDPALTYNPNDYAEGRTSGTPSDGSVTNITYTAAVEEVKQPTISYSDVYSTPSRVAGGLEFIMSRKATLFANGGYTHSEGNEGDSVEVVGTLLKISSTQAYDTATLMPVGGPINSTEFIPNVPIAHYAYDFTDMERYDLEVGGRYYFDPIVKDQAHRTLTPFIGASVGAAHHNSQSFDITQNQVFYERAFESTTDPRTLDTYNVPGPRQTVDLYNAQWVPTGRVTAGMEWQLTPKAALALESGVTFEGARDYANGAKGDNYVSIPLTLRGSYNF